MVLSFFFKSPDPEKLMPDLGAHSVSLQSESFSDSLSYLTKSIIVTFGALEYLLSHVSPLMKFHQLRVLLCFFKPPDSEKLLPHFLH